MRTTTSRILAGCIGAVVLATGTTATTAAEPQSPTASHTPTGESSGEQSTAGDDATDGPSISGRCGDTFSPTISGAEASWTLHCSHPPLIDRVTGYVKDTRMDGLGAILYFTDSDGHPVYKPQARGWGEVKKFDIDVGYVELNGKLSVGW